MINNKPLATDTRLDALDEVQKRVEARQHFMAYSSFVAPWYEPGPHHFLVAEKLEQVLLYIKTGGKQGIGRLIINEPFRHGKSEQVTRLLPSFGLGSMPWLRVILTSYGADLAEDDSRKVRDFVESDNFEALFGGLRTIDALEQPVQVDRDSRKKANWNLENNRGGVVAAGIGGGIVGKGAHLFIIDDPYKLREEADSPVYRKKVTSWYRGSVYSRLEPGGAIILIHHRWHTEDLTGEVLKDMASGEGDKWEVLHLPAIAFEEEEYPKTEQEFEDNLLKGIYIPYRDPLGRAPGEALWPARYPIHVLRNMEKNMREEFTSQGQQMPKPQTGNFFDEQDFEIVDYIPEGLKWYAYVDLALGKNKLSNWNAVMPVALDEKTGKVYGRDMLRIRDLDDFLEQLVLKMLDPREKGIQWGIETVAFQSLVWKQLMKDKRLVKVSIEPITPEDDKVTRARPVRTRAKAGLVCILRAKWNKPFLLEATTFPSGNNADQVDTMSGGYEMIAGDDLVEQKGATAPAQVAEVAQLFDFVN